MSGLVLSMVVGVFVTRYLGPEKYGLLNYAAAFSALVGSFVTLGTETFVVKELVERPADADEILGSAWCLQFIAGATALVLSVTLISFLKRGDALTILLVALTSAAYLFQPLNVIELYFQSIVRAKYSVWARNAASFAMVCARGGLVIAGASVTAFAVTGVLGTIVSASLLVLVFRRFGGRSVATWRIRTTTMKRFVAVGWPLMLAAISSMINMRVDQVMLGTMLDETAVGIYAAAVRLSEVWLSFPMLIGSSIFPYLIRSKQEGYDLFRRRVHRIVLLSACFAVPFAVAMAVFSRHIVTFLLGRSFSDAGPILSIHIWSGLPYVTGFAYGQVFYVENLTRLTIYTSVYTVASNTFLNLFMIPRFGALGAAYTSMFSALSAFGISMWLLNRNSEIFRRPHRQSSGNW